MDCCLPNERTEMSAWSERASVCLRRGLGCGRPNGRMGVGAWSARVSTIWPPRGARMWSSLCVDKFDLFYTDVELFELSGLALLADK